MKIDGKDMLKEYGLGVINSQGILDLLKRKEILKHEWSDRNGSDYFVEKDDIYFEQRTIRLECFIVADSNTQLQNRIQQISHLLDKPLLRTFDFQNIEKPYLLYPKTSADISPLTHGIRTGKNIAKFTLELIEPEPVHPYIIVQDVSASEMVQISIQMVSPGKARIYWGDGETALCSSSSLTAYPHIYKNAGTYKISFVGDYDLIYKITAGNIKYAGNVDNILKTLKAGNTINFAGASMTGYNGGVIQKNIATLNFNQCNFATSDDVNRILRALINDGTYVLAERPSAMTIYLDGTGMPECTDWDAYDTLSYDHEVYVNGTHP